MKKTLILHDTFLYKWGGERFVYMLGKALDADIASGFFHPNSFDLRAEGFKNKLIAVTSPIFKKGLRHIKLKIAFLFKTKFIKEYNTVVFSGDCLSAIRNCKKDTKKIYYCHTPPRYLFDQKERYLRKISWYVKPVYKIVLWIFEKMYFADLKKVDVIYTNSKNTQKRIKKFTGRDAVILYPPVDRKTFKPLKKKSDYYLSCSRISEIKRVDRIIGAFIKMPDKKLLVIYGKNDPQALETIALAEGHDNISCITLEDNSELPKYVAQAIASIYIPVDEDFGMIPVESMSCGVPVVGVNEGGLKESIVHEQTGILISVKSRVPDIIKAVSKMTPEYADSLKNRCIDRAKDFGYTAFKKQALEMIK